MPPPPRASTLAEVCNFHPEQCVVDEEQEPCGGNTTGEYCEKCADGYFGDATRGTPDDCQSCPCPLPDNKCVLIAYCVERLLCA